MNTKTLLLPLCLLCGILLFSSCSKDEDNGGDSNNIATLLTTGAWAFDWYNETEQDLWHGHTLSGNPLRYCDVYTFKSDGTFTEVYKTQTYSGTYKLEGNKLSVSFFANKESISITCYTGNVTINGKSVKAIRSVEKTPQMDYDPNAAYYSDSKSTIFLQVQPEWQFITYN